MAAFETTLADLHPGEAATVLELYGGHGFIGRMAALGFTPGATVQVVRNSGVGPIIVSVLDTQIALGRGEARHVNVRLDPSTIQGSDHVEHRHHHRFPHHPHHHGFGWPAQRRQEHGVQHADGPEPACGELAGEDGRTS